MTDDDEYDTEEEEDEEARLAKAAAKAHLASNAKLQITTSSRVGGGNDSKIFRMEMPARATLGELFATLKQNHVRAHISLLKYDQISQLVAVSEKLSSMSVQKNTIAIRFWRQTVAPYQFLYTCNKHEKVPVSGQAIQYLYNEVWALPLWCVPPPPVTVWNTL